MENLLKNKIDKIYDEVLKVGDLSQYKELPATHQRKLLSLYKLYLNDIERLIKDDPANLLKYKNYTDSYNDTIKRLNKIFKRNLKLLGENNTLANKQGRKLYKDLINSVRLKNTQLKILFKQRLNLYGNFLNGLNKGLLNEFTPRVTLLDLPTQSQTEKALMISTYHKTERKLRKFLNSYINNKLPEGKNNFRYAYKQAYKILEKSFPNGKVPFTRRYAVKDSQGNIKRYKTGVVNMSLNSYCDNWIQWSERNLMSQGAIAGTKRAGYKYVIVQGGLSMCSICSQYANQIFSIDMKDNKYPYLSKIPPFHPHCVHYIQTSSANWEEKDHIIGKGEVLNYSNNKTEHIPNELKNLKVKESYKLEKEGFQYSVWREHAKNYHVTKRSLKGIVISSKDTPSPERAYQYIEGKKIDYKYKEGEKIEIGGEKKYKQNMKWTEIMETDILKEDKLLFHYSFNNIKRFGEVETCFYEDLIYTGDPYTYILKVKKGTRVEKDCDEYRVILTKDMEIRRIKIY